MQMIKDINILTMKNVT